MVTSIPSLYSRRPRRLFFSMNIAVFTSSVGVCRTDDGRTTTNRVEVAVKEMSAVAGGDRAPTDVGKLSFPRFVSISAVILGTFPFFIVSSVGISSW